MRELYSRALSSFLEPITSYLEDPTVSEVMINGPNEIYIERGGQMELTSSTFSGGEVLMSAIQGIAQFVGKRIGEDRPYLDARLPDGSRVSAILFPCARSGIILAIRKFQRETLSLSHLIEGGSLSPDLADLLRTAVLLKKNILISGGTGSGKTSLLNILSSFIPRDQRVIVIEDSSELQIREGHVVCLEARPADRHGRGEVTIRDLLTVTLRLRPDRIIIGEVRGGEAMDLIMAMNTGHGGSLATIHASSPPQALLRLETMALMSDLEIPLPILRHQISSSVDIIVQASRFNDGTRKVTHLSEVHGLDERGQYLCADLFRFSQEGKEASGRIIGRHHATGETPSFYEEIRANGYQIPATHKT